MMLCYWGETVKPDGFGLVKADSVKFTETGVGYLTPTAQIREVSPGTWTVGFVRVDGVASFISLTRKEDFKFGKRKTLSGKLKFKLITCGEDNAVLLSKEDRVFALEKSNNYSPRPISELNNKTVIQVACGDYHFMALTNDSQLFTWGRNTRGQLGFGENGSSDMSPHHLESLNGIPLAEVSAGAEHSFALSLSGAVFGWGRNNAGQLGLGHTEDVHIPTCVTHLNQKETISISCGEEHTATLSKRGTVFTFGSGRYGQLGHNSFRDELIPLVVTELTGINISQITCGRHHTLALVKSSNTVYSFGCGEQGQLGNGQRTSHVPLPVQLPNEVTNSQTVERIIAGGNQSFVLCSPKESDISQLNQKTGILTLKVETIDRWVSTCESNRWKSIKKEIKRIFSSQACINGSFINISCDKHYQTSTNISGLNMKSVKAAFKRLAKKEKVLLEVEKVVESVLLPSLCCNADGVEALRVFLVVAELIQVLNDQKHKTQLTASYASAILKLDPCMMTVLENFWSELPETCFKTLVKLFHTSAAGMISKRTYDFREKLDTPIRESVQVLQMLYKASSKTQREGFIIYELNDLVDMLHAVQKDINNFDYNWGLPWCGNINVMLEEKQHYLDTFKLLTSSPCIFTLEAKYSLLRFRDTKNCFMMELRRTELLDDCFHRLKAAKKSALKGSLQVVFSENLTKSNVNKSDFFHETFKMLLDPESGMFMYNDTKTLAWFPVEPSLPEEKYIFLGLLCGLAFYNNCVVNIPFPLALFKKLLDIKPSLDDFAELDPVMAKSLQYLLDYSDDDAENMDMTYTISWNNKNVELDPDEPGKVVTSSNKNMFVHAYVDYVLNKSVEQVCDAFKKGFYKVCERNLVNFFQPEELRGVMLGSEEYDWDAFKQNTTYTYGFNKNHPTVLLFWEVFEELPIQDKKAFLLFLTGFDRVPILGMGEVKMRVQPLHNSTENHMPQSYTCHTILELPIYQTKQILRAKLIEAIHHKRGFWEE